MVRIPTIGSLAFRLLRTMTAAGALSGLSHPAAWAEPPLGLEQLQPAAPVSGSLVIGGGGTMPPEVIDKFFELGGGSKAKIVIITTASQMAGTEEVKERFAHWLPRPHQSLSYLHTRDRREADSLAFSECLTEATAVWFAGGNQNLITEAYLGTLVETRLHDMLKRGGVIGGTSAGAAIMTQTMIAGGIGVPHLGTGFGFLKGAIVDQHFAQRNRQGRLMQAIESHPGQIGLGINENTALVVRGRKLEVIGEEVAICISGTHERPTRVESLAKGQTADLIRLSRAAVGRTQDNQNLRRSHPEVARGTLVIAGHGPTPTEAVSKFFDAAGGKEGSFVVLSTTHENDSDSEVYFCDWMKDAGVEVRQVSVKKPNTMTSANVREVLKDATGVWIAGSHLGHMVESYLDTPVQKLVTAVLHRGGAVGGTSAGAAIQGDYLVDDSLADHQTGIAEGYERGFGFLPGVAIGPTLARTSPFDDVSDLKRPYPADLVGLEVPEATALIVSGTKMEVVGKNSVSVYDRKLDDSAILPLVELIKAGESYDFKQRRRFDGNRVDVTLTK